MNAAWTDEYDIVIIGSGAGSAPAALVAAAMGKRPLIVEKTEYFGGSTAMSGGVFWAPNNAVMKRNGVSDSYDQARAYLDACAGDAGPASSPARRHAFLTGAPRMVDFLERKGMRFVYAEGYSDYHEGEHPGGLARGRSIEAAIFDRNRLGDLKRLLRPPVFDVPALAHEFPALTLNGRTFRSKLKMIEVGFRLLRKRLGADLAGSGAAVQGRLLEIAARNGIPIWVNSPVTQFVVEAGRVVGVELRREGEARRVRAGDGVIVVAGGFARNLAMRQKYQLQPTSVDWTNANPGDTGEIIELAMGLGAGVDIMEQSWWTAISVMPDGARAIHPGDMSRPHCFMVDAAGDRFVNESTSYMTVGIAMYERHRTVAAVPSWLVMDSRHRNRYRWGGHPPGKPPADWISTGYMKTAGTLEDLAVQCGIDAERLKATAARFNGFARTGVDEDFNRGKSAYDRGRGDPSNRPNANLGAVEQPPFYAVRLYPGDVGTCGGLLTDEHARVLRDDLTPIDGLYAAGNSTASVFGRSYPGAGASIAASAVFAWIAARHALGVNGDQP